jgi:hypothetical protein
VTIKNPDEMDKNTVTGNGVYPELVIVDPEARIVPPGRDLQSFSL